ncbi:MAG: hypothetical protein AB1782_11325 [Cyanobacteriota bacterium]
MGEILELFFGNKREDSHIGLSAIKAYETCDNLDKISQANMNEEDDNPGWLNIARNSF